MLLFVTSPGHSYTVRSLFDGTFGARTPPCQVTTYELLFRSQTTRRATHIFCDIERLYSWELILAADLYRTVRLMGLRCLNDPARVMSRYELLRNLHRAGLNPFTAYRAEERPAPARFPVFIRNEADHSAPISDLLSDQAELDSKLSSLRQDGVPMRGLLVVEYAAEPIAPGVWRKFGTFRVGTEVLVDHCVIEDCWIVKYGKLGLATDAWFGEEKDEVTSNRLACSLKPAFELAGVEWGRADHASLSGSEVVYEINTNPELHALEPQRSPIRDETLRFARDRMARHLWELDSGDGAPIPLRLSQRLRNFQQRCVTLGPNNVRP